MKVPGWQLSSDCDIVICELTLCKCCASEGCVRYTSLNVVCDEVSDGVRYVGVYEFVDEFIYIHIVKRFAYIKYCRDCTGSCILVISQSSMPYYADCISHTS